MRKYLQIIFVLGAFFLLVYLKNLPANAVLLRNPIRNFERGDDDGPRTIGSPQQKALVTGTQVQPTTPLSAPTTSQTAPTTAPKGAYKDGTYTGSVEDAFYGNYQVQAVITNGRLADINFLQYPSDNGTSLRINSESMPILKAEALAAQSAQVDIVSGASDSSPAFIRSLTTALSQAK